MSDLSKLRISGTDYNLKDAQARSDITALNGSLDTVVVRNLTKNTTWVIGKAIQAGTGIAYNSSGAAHTDFINISNCSRIMYMRRFANLSYAPAAGMAFYDANKNYISGVSDGYESGSDEQPKVNTLVVPENVVYARFTYTSIEEILADYPFFVYDADLYEAALEMKVKQNTDDISAHYNEFINAEDSIESRLTDVSELAGNNALPLTAVELIVDILSAAVYDSSNPQVDNIATLKTLLLDWEYASKFGTTLMIRKAQVNPIKVGTTLKFVKRG